MKFTNKQRSQISESMRWLGPRSGPQGRPPARRPGRAEDTGARRRANNKRILSALPLRCLSAIRAYRATALLHERKSTLSRVGQHDLGA